MKRLCVWSVGTLLALGCGPRAPVQLEPQSPAAAPSAHGHEPRVVLPDADWQDVVVSTQALVVPLPDRAGWRDLPSRGGWSGFEHSATQSQLWLRHRLARRSVSAEECEKQATSSLVLLRETGSEAVATRLAAPAGYLGQTRVSILEGDRARIFAFGAGVSRCYAAVFVTAGGGDLVGRLDLAGERVIVRVRLAGLDERALGTHF